jgi:TRAP-type C4-dicarboxylate transport system permease small subunit
MSAAPPTAMPAVMSSYVRIVSMISRAGAVLALLLMAAAVLVVNEMVFMRYVLKASTIWQTEFVIFSLVAATFLGSPYVLMEMGHVNGDILVVAAGPRGGLVLQVIAGLIGLSFCALLAWSGWLYFHEAWAERWTTDTIWALPLWIPLLPLPAGIGLLCLQYVAELIKLKDPGA